MKDYINRACCVIFMVLVTIVVGYVAYHTGLESRAAQPEKLVIELLMEIQEIVDCNLIDGKIGPETKRLVNAQTAKDRPILFNRYAAPYHTPSGAPKGE